MKKWIKILKLEKRKVNFNLITISIISTIKPKNFIIFF